MYAGSVIESFAPVFQFLFLGGKAAPLIVLSAPMKACPDEVRLLRVDAQQIDQREYEHPDEIDEVPVQAAHFDVVGRPLSLAVSRANNCEISDPDRHVQHVQTSEPEESAAEEWHTPRI
jgi:hypothetical protein